MKSLYLYLFCAFIVMLQPDCLFAQGDVYAQGNIEMREGNYQQAEYYYKIALEREPKNVLISNALGICLMAQKKYLEADKVFESAIELDTNYQTTFWNLAKSATYQRKDSVAIDWYERFIRVAERQKISVTQAHLNVVMCYERMLTTTGILQEQYYNLMHHANRFMVLFPDAPEIRPLQEFLSKLASSVPDFNVPGQRFVYRG
ncbi:MAG: tetratricopeptide repeat protein [Bacteroidia bacterium]|nr:tetratricopeptide repeat protein [Bacteroidia bacterium]